MRNLLATDFMRLWKSKAFWGCFAAGNFYVSGPQTLGRIIIICRFIRIRNHWMRCFFDDFPLNGTC